MSLLCRFGIHRRYRPGRALWECHGCPALWRRRYDQNARGRWEKIR